MYVDGSFDELSVPIDHIYKKTTDEVFTIHAKLGEHIILPCRPVHPNVTVELYRQDKRPNERIVDTISNINAKVFSTKFYQHHLTPLFYYHPRIGFVLDSVTEDDKGRYHCLFTASYKYEEIKTFVVTFSNPVENPLGNLTGSSGDLSLNNKSNVPESPKKLRLCSVLMYAVLWLSYSFFN